MGGAEVAIRGIKATVSSSVDVSDRAGRPLGIITSITNPVIVTVSGAPDVNITDRAARLLGVVYGNVDQLQQRSVTKELLVQLTSAGIQIDPRDRNWDLNFATDQVDVSGSSITATISGTPDVNVTDRAARLLGIAYGSQSQQLLQRAVTFDLITQLRTSGTEYDARDRNWDLNFATDQVDVSGSTITTTNTPTTPILDYNTGLGIGSGSSSTHTYTATGNFKLSSIQASSSGAMKIEVKAGASGSETTKMIAFTTESNLTAQLRFYEEIQLTTGQRIQIVRTNREIESMDVYSTILGFNT